jgi:acetate kinase
VDLAGLNVLAVNAGSTSLKLTRFHDGTEHTLPDLAAAFDAPPPELVVHRVVHGGPRTTPTLIDDAELSELRALIELAPLHQPPALAAIDRCRARWPHVRQYACFDTAFHADLPAAARTYALPARLRARVQVHGFHGLSYAWATRQAARTHPRARRVLIAHLGGGQSLCGVLDGRSVITTMGFSPLDGLVMATRSGTVDTSALLWLSEHGGEPDLTAILEQESGLLGLAGTPDMREILTRVEAGEPDARLALDVWLHRFLREAGGAVAVLGGCDLIVFTGGIGEHSEAIRELVNQRLSWIGASSTVVPAREDLQMLHEVTATYPR